jgi:hydrogenase small subunit
MPGFPDKFMPFMDEPPGAALSGNVIKTYGRLIRSLRAMTNETVNREARWRHNRPELTTGYNPRWPHRRDEPAGGGAPSRASDRASEVAGNPEIH